MSAASIDDRLVTHVFLPGIRLRNWMPLYALTMDPQRPDLRYLNDDPDPVFGQDENKPLSVCITEALAYGRLRELAQPIPYDPAKRFWIGKDSKVYLAGDDPPGEGTPPISTVRA